MSKNKVLGLLAIVIAVLVGIFLYQYSLAPPQQSTKELDFTVSGTSDCLRFLNSSVPIIYVPFTTTVNENWQLTINCTKMPGGAGGWTDVYIYKGYWDKGTNHSCVSEDLYSILGDIESTNRQIRANSAFTATYGGPTSESYTVFFVIPPGGQGTFHVTYKQE